jgi:pyruvate, water dikinase
VRSRSWRIDAIAALIAPFEGLPADAISIAGGKGASLARMAAAGLPVPRGFVVCTEAFHSMLQSPGASNITARLSGTFDVHDTSALDAAAEEIRALILGRPLPDEIAAAIRSAYRALGHDLRVAVRSSAVSEDGEAASFAGQQETFLNVQGEDAVLGYVRECWASFFSPRALFYRAQKGALSDTRMAVVVQEMVLAEKSGVLFTVDPILKQRDRMIVEAVFGLGEGIVSGAITPDHYVLDRETGELVEEFIAHQEAAVFYDPEKGGTRHVDLPEGQGAMRVLTDDELKHLRATGLRIEEFFGRPQDIEWSIRGNDLLLLQSRPITTL